MASIIRDASLAPQGRQKIEWARRHMAVLDGIAQDLKRDRPLEGLKVAVSIHLEAKTAYLAQVLHQGGADVFATGSNPLSTQDDVCAALSESGVTVYATHGCTAEEYHDYLCRALSEKPDVLIDDGGDMVHILHEEHPEWAENLRGGCEETTTGVIRLRSRAAAGRLNFPMFSINDADCKHLFDNRYGTGQSVWDGIMRTTNLNVAGSTVVVAGYGWCGKGVTMRAKGLGAKVIVTEVDPVRAIEAVMDGFTVMPMEKAAPLGDLFITVTGCRDVVTPVAYAADEGRRHDVQRRPLRRGGGCGGPARHGRRALRGAQEHRRLPVGKRPYRVPAGRGPAGEPGRGRRTSGGNHGHELRPSGAVRAASSAEGPRDAARALRRAPRHRRRSGASQAHRAGRED